MIINLTDRLIEEPQKYYFLRKNIFAKVGIVKFAQFPKSIILFVKLIL